MNAPRLLFLNARKVRVLLGAGACVLTGACVGALEDTRIDPASPVAGDVARLSRANPDFPSFAEIPGEPLDVRPLREYGRQAQTLRAAGAELERATAPETWTLSESEAFAEGARRAAPDVEPSERPQDSEAFARELRERATPPPPR